MIPFNIPLVTGNEHKYIQEVLNNRKMCGDGPFTKKCDSWLEEHTKTKKSLLTTSCTHALEMSALLVDIQPGDEVIMPSFTFVSTANPFVLRNAKIIFVDIRPDTLNIDETKIETAITDKTKAIVPVHYAGISCEMDKIMELAKKYNLFVIEDAAQGMMSAYKNRELGSIGHIGCFSFHETKNYQCGEGGAILINDESLIEKAEIIREKGTNRSKFLRGQIDKYTWVDVGSSYLPSELNAAFLYAQFEMAEEVNNKRLNLWNKYYTLLSPLKEQGKLQLPGLSDFCRHNGHIFYIKLKDIKQRQNLINFLKENRIQSVFHYIPLHSTIIGKKVGIFHGEDKYTTSESEKLLRLPMYYDLKEEQVGYICNKITEFLI